MTRCRTGARDIYLRSLSASAGNELVDVVFHVLRNDRVLAQHPNDSRGFRSCLQPHSFYVAVNKDQALPRCGEPDMCQHPPRCSRAPDSSLCVWDSAQARSSVGLPILLRGQSGNHSCLAKYPLSRSPWQFLLRFPAFGPQSFRTALRRCSSGTRISSSLEERKLLRQSLAI